jgi:protein phosphatase
MLVCPHCQFENPDAHKFCQCCGASLTEKDCPVCGALVAFDSEYCLECGAVTGTIWKAILSPVGMGVSQAGATDPSDLLDVTTATVLLPTDKFLDTQQRYQLLEPLPQQIALTTEVEVRVLDNQPLQVSGLYHLLHPSEAGESEPVPEIAKPYLTLQEQFPGLSVPRLHDAWQQSGLNVLLLEDRSHLPLLVDLWLDENVLPLQILHWLHEMTELWAALEFQRCCRSLLEISNLRVDEDHLLCLQRLYFDPPDQAANLAQLGCLWQKLFQQSQCTQNADLSRLCAELAAGMIGSPEHLRLRIEAIATALHSAQSASMTSSVPSPEEFKASPEATSSTEITQDLRPTPLPTIIPATGEEAAVDSIQPLADEDEDEGSTDDQPTVVLAMRLVSLEDAGQTDIGRQRNHNEDCFSVQTEIKKIENLQGRTVQAKGLYILCDGMGGHASGEVASALAVETVQQYFAEHWHDKLPSEEHIREAIQRANRVIFNQNQQNASAGSGRMGTTLVLLLIHNTEAAVAHVGDSRLYWLSRRRRLQQLTVDHEVGQREIQRGVEPAIAYARPDAYQLTQALGPRDANFLNPDVKFMELNEDGVLLLCSDGLSDNELLETHWQSHLEPLLDQRANLEQGVNQLIDLANQYNGHDNITAIAVRIKVRPNLDQKF